MVQRMVRQHEWVKHIVIPVQVVPNPDTDQPNAVMLNDDIDKGLVRGITGCKHCSIPLNSETVKTSCVGYDI